MSTPRVDVIYDSDCPNVELARSNVRIALAAAALPLKWREWCRPADRPLPAGYDSVGSPTVFVDGRDVDPPPAVSARSCRTYVDTEGALSRAPTVAAILASLTATR